MFDETRDNTTAIEATIIEADKREREESAPYPPAYPFPVFGDGETDAREKVFGRPVRPFRQPEERHEEINDGANGYDDVKIAREHDEIVAKARQESEERNGRDDEPEDDGQPSEYTEWQDYMGGDEYYDHSENEMW